MAHKHVHAILSRTCESFDYVTLESKILPYKVADKMEVANQLNLSDLPRLSWITRRAQCNNMGP